MQTVKHRFRARPEEMRLLLGEIHPNICSGDLKEYHPVRFIAKPDVPNLFIIGRRSVRRPLPLLFKPGTGSCPRSFFEEGIKCRLRIEPAFECKPQQCKL